LSFKSVVHGEVVWLGKPWVVPAAIIRTVTVIVVAILFVWLEVFSGTAFASFVGLPVYAWTLVAFVVIRASNTYILRRDGLEIRRGIIRLHSFVVTPSGFGDLMVYQPVGGRIFGYGDLTVNSQGERETKLSLVRSPFTTADTVRDIMGKPVVRVEDHA
jgi:uncharacterized membrane protein YdbT with pleckstrin-like domain